jgi:serine/threonine-protein kinase SRK2
VANRDLKLENTLLDGARPLPMVKLADFGFSKADDMHSAPGSRVGTPAYLAPEVIDTRAGGTYDGKAADVWSLGVLLYVLTVGRYPFSAPASGRRGGADNERMEAVLRHILKAEYAYPEADQPSAQCRDLIAAMLVRDPAKRAAVGAVMRHPWYQHGMPPSILSFNDVIVAQSPRADPELAREVEEIIKDAQAVPPRAGGGGGGGGALPPGDTLMDAVIDEETSYR